MFNIGNFLMKTLNGMIGAYPDFQVREYALNWYAKGKLTEEDLASIDASIEAQYIVPEPPVVEEPIEESDTSTNEEVVEEPAEEPEIKDETLDNTDLD